MSGRGCPTSASCRVTSPSLGKGVMSSSGRTYMHPYVCAYGDTRLQAYTCVHLSLSGSRLCPFHSYPWPLAHSRRQERSVGVLAGTWRKGRPAGSPLERLPGSQTPRAVPGSSTQALPGKPFPRKSPPRCDRNLAPRGGRGGPQGLLSPRTCSGWKVRVYQLG